MFTSKNSEKSEVFFVSQEGIETSGRIIKLTRNVVSFQPLDPVVWFQTSMVIERFAIHYNDQTIYSGRSVVEKIVDEDAYPLVTVQLLDSWNQRISTYTQEDLFNETKKFISSWGEQNKIDSHFKIAIEDIKSFCLELKEWFKKASLFAESSHLESIFEKDGFVRLITPAYNKLVDLFDELEKVADKIPSKDVQRHKEYAQKHLHHLMLQGPFIHRSYQKPLGYAGDYEMVNMICSDFYQGKTPFAKFINAFLLKSVPAQAHRNRIKILENTLKKEVKKNKRQEFRVLSIGSGPAIEIQRFIRNCKDSNKAEIYLLDFNKKTLDFAKEKINQAMDISGNKPKVYYVHLSVMELIRNRMPSELISNKFDFIYCAGLFDYLSDKICKKLMSLMRSWINNEGLLLSTNVHKNNPSRYLLEYIMEWYLLQRNEEDMLSLLDIEPQEATVYTDETGANVFVEVRGSIGTKTELRQNQDSISRALS